ncbi:MAG: GntR family transcriptional regulator [Paracoccaceae bacterium]
MTLIGKAAPDGPDPARLPAHETVYRALRGRILFGEMAPGQPVTIQGLAEDLGAGMTPVREAIRRLTAEGALVFQGNRRVSVPRLTAGNVGELIFARAAIEPQLALRATQHVDPAGLERLAAEDSRLDAAIADGNVGGYLRHNHGFHAMLHAMAQAPILAALADGLWLRFGPSLRVVCGRVGTQNLPDRHKETLAAMRAGDAEAAAQAIREDVLQGMEHVRAALAGTG